MTACSTSEGCGTGIFDSVVRPSDPDNNLVLTASPAFGGIDVAWSLPTVRPYAVAHVLIYRSLLNTFASAIRIAAISGDSYYDKLDTSLTYYYWIQVVTVNGTYLDVVGPASAQARPVISRVIEQLSGQIDRGMLAESLKASIDTIPVLSAGLAQEVTDRIQGNQALTNTINQLQIQVGDNATLISQETTQRTTQYSALAGQINALGTRTDDNTTAIVAETLARTSATEALTLQINTAQSTLEGNIAAVQTFAQTGITSINGTLTQIGALYTARLTVNGLVGGFGVYNDGSTVEAGFDVDTFWVGRTQSNKRKPFIVADGEVFMDQAVINSLTFTKLRDESGSLLVQNGKVKAQYLQVNELNAGGFTGWGWPTVGSSGGHMSSTGLLLGNYQDRGYLVFVADNGFFEVGKNGGHRLTLTNGEMWLTGNLNGAGGTFSGTLTANAVNAVNSINLANNSVTVQNSSSGGGYAACNITIPANVSGTIVAVASSSNANTYGPGNFGENSQATLTITIAGNSSSITTQIGSYVANEYTQYAFPAAAHVHQVKNLGPGTYTIAASGWGTINVAAFASWK